MLSNLFSNVNVSNKLFTLNDSSILELSIDNSKELDAKEIEESLVLPYENNKGKKVIIKAFSLQPNLNGYGTIVKERKEDLKKGLEKIKSVSKFKFVVDGRDKNLQESLKEYGEIIKVSSTTDLYESKLISKVYSEEKDIAIYDIIEIIQLGQALNGKSTEILTTVYGSAINGRKVVALKKGTTYKEVFDALNGNANELKKVINGGSINGTPIYNLDSVIGDTTTGILFLTEKDSPSEASYSCIRCGKCLRVCPEGLNPIKLVELYKMGAKEEFVKFGGEKCIDCGLCSFVCPSNIEIAQTIKTSKTFK
ncbi:4Fe-4S dicluster domain-containing protein [Clostridium tertium]|uniref:4Fe-4S dicluster domain-containing protein n=1 Tax=Clostridium TaxID=1485 RepID=UPI00189AAE93|nr:4Fe-4S dicluster domain-containing protein [Clostridium tertium]MDI9215198.1 4Fe-4S dicluster domain-containing protein [Clostridium tertium]